MPDVSTLILDACAIINLVATDRLPDILEAVNRPVVVCDTVAGEALYLRRGGSGDDASDRDPIDLLPWVRDGRLAIIRAENDDELATFVDLALNVDDGEAKTIALAVHRSLTVVTDDRKATRIATGLVPIQSSLELVKVWIEKEAVDSQAINIVLNNFRDRARYFPHAQHPLRTWWDIIHSGISAP